ncbi:hypothetical protein V865_000772 [Kwoniella europaea PYCC6329]|uniref:Uncharacterized protein n=1 Tax=Kwoniella europaea PYCC6329 TaxID=1423913 RepID=A0AAX4KAT6_9TREE
MSWQWIEPKTNGSALASQSVGSVLVGTLGCEHEMVSQDDVDRMDALSTLKISSEFLRSCDPWQECLEKVQALTISGEEALTEEQMNILLGVTELSQRYARALTNAQSAWTRLNDLQDGGDSEEGGKISFSNMIQVDPSTASIRKELKDILHNNAKAWMDSAEKTMKKSFEELESSRKIMTVLSQPVERSELRTHLLIRVVKSGQLFSQSTGVYQLAYKVLKNPGTIDTLLEKTFEARKRHAQEEFEGWKEVSQPTSDLYIQWGTELLSGAVEDAKTLVDRSKLDPHFRSSAQRNKWDKESTAHRERFKASYNNFLQHREILETLFAIASDTESEMRFKTKCKEWHDTLPPALLAVDQSENGAQGVMIEGPRST